MKKSNIKLEVARLRTCLFKKCSEKIYTRLYSWLDLKGFRLDYSLPSLADVGPASPQHWANVSCYLGSVSGAGMESVIRITMPIPQSANTHPKLFQWRASVEDFDSTLKQHWVNNTCLLMCWRKVYSRPSAGLVLGQRRRQLTYIEPAIGCDAGLTLNRNLVGRSTSSVRGTS